MARYYFDTQDGETVTDANGMELRDIDEVKISAVRFLSELLDDRPERLWETQHFQIVVRNEDHLVLFLIDTSVTLSAAMGSSFRP